MATLNFPDEPTTGDIYTDSNSGFSYEWNGTVWISTDPQRAANIREIDDISGDFDGSDTTFTLKVAGVNIEPVNAQQLVINKYHLKVETWLMTEAFERNKQLTEETWLASNMSYNPETIEVVLSSAIDAVGANAPDKVLTRNLVGSLPVTGSLQNR